MSTRRASRFELSGLIARTRASTIFRALDTRSGTHVALRVAAGEDAALAERALAALADGPDLLAFAHPRIATLRDFGPWNQSFSTAEELISGQTLAEALGGGPAAFPVAIEIAIQVAEALASCHQSGFLHLAIDPTHVFLVGKSSGAAPAKREEVDVRMVGLARGRLRQRGTMEFGRMEDATAPFCAPEVLEDRDKGAAGVSSDVFSLAGLVYWLLCGSPPWTDLTVGNAAAGRPRQAPLALASRAQGVPDELDATIRRALSVDPSERPQSLAELVKSLRAAANARRAPGPGDEFELQVFSTRDFRLPLIERDLEMTRLRVQFDQAVLGRGGFALLAGEPGSGKTRLMEELRSYVLACQGLFLWTQATEFDSNRPFAALRETVRQFVRHTQSLASQNRAAIRRRVQKALGDFGNEIRLTIPEAEDLLAESPELVALEPERERQRSAKTLLNLFRALSGPGLPILLFIDDYQWADRGTRGLIERLRRELDDTFLMVVCAESVLQGDSAPDEDLSPETSGARSFLRIELQPLTQSGCRRLFEESLGRSGVLVKDLATIAFERCGGSPRLLNEIIRTLEKELVSLPAARSSDLGLLRLQTLIPEANVESFLERRWTNMPSGERELLAMASVIGRKFSLSLLEALAQSTTPEILRALALGAHENLVGTWSVLGEDWHYFRDEKIHDAIYKSIPVPTRLKHHRRIAEILEPTIAKNPSAIYEVALHHLRGDDAEKAHEYSVLAARTAKKAFANEEAIFFFSEALRLLPESKRDLEASIREDLGDACSLNGQYAEAETHFQHVRERATDALHVARLEGKIGETHFRRGMNLSAISHLESALAVLGFRSPRSRPGILLSIGLRLARQCVHSLLPADWFKSSDPGFRARAQQAVKIYHALAYACYFLDMPRTLEVHLRQLNLAERLGRSPELAHTYSSHGIVCSLIPLHRRALRYQRIGLELRKSFGDRWGIGQSYAFLGVCCYYRTEYSQAIEHLKQSIRILESTGDQWEIEAAYSHLGFCYVHLGKIDAGEKTTLTLLRLSQEINDLKFIALANITLAECDLIRGNLDRALSAVDRGLAASVDHFTTAMAMRLKGQILLRLQRQEEAIATLGQSLEIIHKNGLRNEYLVANSIAMAEARLHDVDRILSMGGGARKRYLRKTRKFLDRGLRLARCFQNQLGYALRVRAIFHRLAGDSPQADRDFHQSKRVLTRQGRLYELGRTILEAAIWKSREGGIKDLDDFHQAVDIFRKIGARLDIDVARKYLGLQNATEELKQLLRNEHRQLSSLFKMSRTISSILDLDRLVIQITDLAVEFTGGERGFLFLRGEDGKPRLRCARGMDHNEISFHLNSEAAAVVHRVWQTGIAQVASIIRPTTTNESAGEEQGRSVICGPLRIGDNAIGLIFIENRLTRDLYTDDDLEFLSAFASQAAVSLQNALFYQKAEDLNSKLELKVQERTRELLTSKQDLEKANRLKSEFLANMSHELRTPLNAIIAMSEILAEKTFGDLSPKQDVYVKHILDSGVHLLSLINDVLDLSKVEAGQLELEMDLFDLNDLLKSSLVIVKEQAHKHGIALEFQAGPRDALLRGDARRIKQVLYNLLTNAVKFTPDGGRVTLSSRRDEDSMIVCVEDTGIGISKENQEIIFDEFRQVESSYTRRYEGTGLGLALSRKFIELHGGAIWVESEENKGSKFFFCLPVVRTSTEESTANALRLAIAGGADMGDPHG